MNGILWVLKKTRSSLLSSIFSSREGFHESIICLKVIKKYFQGFQGFLKASSFHGDQCFHGFLKVSETLEISHCWLFQWFFISTSSTWFYFIRHRKKWRQRCYRTESIITQLFPAWIKYMRTVFQIMIAQKNPYWFSRSQEIRENMPITKEHRVA